MENTEAATDALREADRLGARARAAGRWYIRYLTFFAIASFAMALCFGLVGPKWGAWVITPLWVAFVVAISMYANRQRAILRGMARIQNVMMLAWGVLWALVLLGSFALQQPLWWWLVGGLALATPPLVARHAVKQRLEP